MPRFDSQNSECRVYTRRAGMLSALGHDLEIGVNSYRIDVEATPLRVRARFDARSLHVLGTVDGGAGHVDKLSPHDREQIGRQIADEILFAARHPNIEFDSTHIEPHEGGYRIRGRLRLRGVDTPIEFSARRQERRVAADVTVHQPDFGIKPFRAFGGALRLHADVRVRVTLHELDL
jgi:hypothetical protein